MRYHELAAALNCAALNAATVGRLGPKQYGFVDQARRAATPHTVDILGMDEEKIGWEQCAAKLNERRDWCSEFCRADWEIEPLRDERMRLVGRRFRFADEVDAVHFKLRFG
jgi:hypothetical protein